MSLRLRVGLAAALVMAVFLGLTMVVLERAFGDALRSGIYAQLEARVYMLLAAAELAPDGSLRLPPHLPEARLTTPGSGLYARVLDGRGAVAWRAASNLGADLPAGRSLAAGRREQGYLQTTAGAGRSHGLFRLAFGVEWEDEDRRLWPFTLEVFEADATYLDQRRGFRRTLGVGVVALALALLLVQGLVLAWGLRPLGRVAADLEAIRAGRRDFLEGRYPRELRPFSDSINRFIEHERAARDRYRDSLGELAHSLKTPLAVLRSSLDADASALAQPAGTAVDRELALTQLRRLGDIVNYQLARAATGGRAPLAAAVAVEPVAASLCASLDKVYRDRAVGCTRAIGAEVRFQGDRGDLLELLGNLLDNAYKWSTGAVRLTAEQGQDGGLLLTVEDDGPGIDEQHRDKVLRRGQRMDQRVAGQGIGLAVVRDLVDAYDGRLSLGRGRMGGLRVELAFPG